MKGSKNPIGTLPLSRLSDFETATIARWEIQEQCIVRKAQSCVIVLSSGLEDPQPTLRKM